MKYSTYILYSEKLDRYYIGSTEDITIRIKEHLRNHKGFTAKAKDWELKYSEEFNTRSEAINREMQIKIWKSRKMIEIIIAKSK